MVLLLFPFLTWPTVKLWSFWSPEVWGCWLSFIFFQFPNRCVYMYHSLPVTSESTRAEVQSVQTQLGRQNQILLGTSCFFRTSSQTSNNTEKELLRYQKKRGEDRHLWVLGTCSGREMHLKGKVSYFLFNFHDSVLKLKWMNGLEKLSKQSQSNKTVISECS